MTPQQRVSFVLADDHPVVPYGVANLLRTRPDFDVVAVCNDGANAARAIHTLAPSIAILEFEMRGMNGIEVLSSIGDASKTKVVFLSAAPTGAQIAAAVSGRARGIILKSAPLDGLVECIGEVAAGHTWFPPDLVERALLLEARRPGNVSLVETLTAREQEVMFLVAEGLSNKEIARRIHVEVGTVKVHLHKIYAKVRVENRIALMSFATAARPHLATLPLRRVARYMTQFSSSSASKDTLVEISGDP